jgi:hypothetical protein
MTLPRTTLEGEVFCCNAAINVVAAYCKFRERGAATRSRRDTLRQSRPVKEASLQLIIAEAEKQAVSTAMLSAFKENRPTICFVREGTLCLARLYISTSQ